MPCDAQRCTSKLTYKKELNLIVNRGYVLGEVIGVLSFFGPQLMRG